MASVRLTILTVACVTGVALVTAVAQPAQGMRQGAPMYDTKSEGTFTGTVEAVENVTPAGAGRRSLGGTHLTLKTGTETLTVHLGPTAFLASQKVEVKEGDTVEILGSRVTIEGEPVVLARQVKKGTETWTLRDEAGLPLWRGSRR